MIGIEITVELLTYVVAGLLVLTVVLIGLLMQTNKRVTNLLRGKNAETLEDTMKTLISQVEKSTNEQKLINRAIKILGEDFQKTISGVGVIRFNPFEGSSGSNQSFSIAMIDKHGDGVVISSLYSRERVSVFAKPLEKFKSTYNLTEEETRALGKARGL
jgi:hypothetical protein